MDLTTSTLELLQAGTPAGTQAANELPRIMDSLEQQYACTIDLQVGDTFRGPDNHQFPLRGFDKRIVILNFGSTQGVVILDGNVATVLAHYSSLTDWGYRDDVIQLKVGSHTSDGKPLTFNAASDQGELTFRRSQMVKLSPPARDPLAGRPEAKKIAANRRKLAELNAAFNAWAQSATNAANKIFSLQQERDRAQETVDSTAAKCAKLDGKIEALEVRIRKGRSSNRRMGELMSTAHGYRMSHDGYAMAFDAAEKRIKEIDKEVKALTKPIPMPEALKKLSA